VSSPILLLHQDAAGTSPRRLLAKAAADFAGVEEASALQALAENSAASDAAGAWAPDYDPITLLQIAEVTPHILPCIEAICQNVDGFGHTAVVAAPWLDDLDSPEALAAIADALAVERWYEDQEDEAAAESEATYVAAKLRGPHLTGRDRRRLQAKWTALTAANLPPPPPDPAEEVEDLRAELRQQLVRERVLFQAWFDHCCSMMPFVELRRRLRADLLTFGWCAVEWLRDKAGRLRRLQYVAAHLVRPLIDEGESVEIEEPDPLTILSGARTLPVQRKFPRYVQQAGRDRIYFKSPRDPRVISRATGQVFPSLDALRRDPEDRYAPDEIPGEGPDAQPANELQWFARHDPRTPVPGPAWIGNLPAVLGGRHADLTNLYYLQGNAIPAGLLLIHGGTVTPDARDRIEARWRTECKGPNAAGRILVVEAVPSAQVAPGERIQQPALTYQSLRESQTNDATFSQYDERIAKRVGAAFRLPDLLRGYIPNDLNRATALAALEFAEKQVFQPLREAFDWRVNQEILPEIGIRLLRFQSNSPPTRSPEEVGSLVQALAPHGGLVPAEVRQLAADAFNHPLARLDADWTTRPLALTLAGISGDSAPAPTAVDGLTEQLRSLEAKVAAIVTEELAAVGLDHQVTARVIAPPPPAASEDPHADDP
jgi:capsid portal protein